MRTRTALVALLLAVPAAGALGGTAAADPYIPVGKPVPATGTITIEGAAAGAVAKPAKRPTASRARATGTRLVPRR